MDASRSLAPELLRIVSAAQAPLAQGYDRPGSGGASRFGDRGEGSVLRAVSPSGRTGKHVQDLAIGGQVLGPVAIRTLRPDRLALGITRELGLAARTFGDPAAGFGLAGGELTFGIGCDLTPALRTGNQDRKRHGVAVGPGLTDSDFHLIVRGDLTPAVAAGCQGRQLGRCGWGDLEASVPAAPGAIRLRGWFTT